MELPTPQWDRGHRPMSSLNRTTHRAHVNTWTLLLDTGEHDITAAALYNDPLTHSLWGRQLHSLPRQLKEGCTTPQVFQYMHCPTDPLPHRVTLWSQSHVVGSTLAACDHSQLPRRVHVYSVAALTDHVYHSLTQSSVSRQRVCVPVCPQRPHCCRVQSLLLHCDHISPVLSLPVYTTVSAVGSSALLPQWPQSHQLSCTRCETVSAAGCT